MIVEAPVSPPLPFNHISVSIFILLNLKIFSLLSCNLFILSVHNGHLSFLLLQLLLLGTFFNLFLISIWNIDIQINAKLFSKVVKLVYTATSETHNLLAQCSLPCLLLLDFYILDSPMSMALFLIPGNFAIFVRCDNDIMVLQKIYPHFKKDEY